MASVFPTSVPAENHTDFSTPQIRPHLSADTPLFHFGLRQLLLFVAGICALLAAMASSSGLTSLVVLLAVAVVVMHVFATALGTRLQLRSEQEQLRQQAVQPKTIELTLSASEQSAKLKAIRSAPR